jgi:hypothetical protein
LARAPRRATCGERGRVCACICTWEEGAVLPLPLLVVAVASSPSCGWGGT